MIELSYKEWASKRQKGDYSVVPDEASTLAVVYEGSTKSEPQYFSQKLVDNAFRLSYNDETGTYDVKSGVTVTVGNPTYMMIFSDQ